MRRAVERGMQRRDVEPIARVGLDEKSFGKGQDYISLLSDIDEGRGIEVAAGRDQQSACMLLEKLPATQREDIEAVAMVMSASFKAAVEAVIPRADIVRQLPDRFHVSKLLNEAVDGVRRRENKELLSRGDESLKATRYSWRFNPANMSDQRLEEFKLLAASNLRTSRAWLHKEDFEGFWSRDSVWRGEGYLESKGVVQFGNLLAP
jgi:transposase